MRDFEGRYVYIFVLFILFMFSIKVLIIGMFIIFKLEDFHVLFDFKFKGALQLFCKVRKVKKLDAKVSWLSVPMGNVLNNATLQWF